MRKRAYFILAAGITFAGITYYFNVYRPNIGNTQNITTYEGEDLRDDTPTIIQELIAKDPQRSATDKEFKEKLALKKRASRLKVGKVEEKILEERVQDGD